MVLAALMLAGCTATPAPQPPQTPSAAVTATRRTHQFSAHFTLRKEGLHSVGKDAEKTYGQAEYRGRAGLLNDSFRAQLLVASDYVQGSGTFEGFVTLVSPKGEIGLRITGVTTAREQMLGSDFSGETEVIGGTGEYVTLAGRGRFTGQRVGPPGSPIDAEVSLELINPR